MKIIFEISEKFIWIPYIHKGSGIDKEYFGHEKFWALNFMWFIITIFK